MAKGFYNVPAAVNEPVLNYAPGSKEKAELKEMLTSLRSQVWDIPMYIGGKEIRTEDKRPISPPHDHKHVIAHYHYGDAEHIELAIKASMNAKEDWENMSWQHRAAIFLKAADLISGKYRAKINAATMLNQSKNAFQAEIDAACETIDFLRFNVQYMAEIYAQQPISPPTIWNQTEQRPLEGFVYAVTPFNFTAIACNLAAAPALMGNTVVWKPSPKQIYSAHVLMVILKEAGLPDGVINLIHDDGPVSSDIVLSHPDFGGIHFTGSTKVFKHFWKKIGDNMNIYKTYPRIVGETGGKDFILAHSSADAKQVATGIIRGAFEYQGQKCSAASRAYIPDNLWEDVKKHLLEDLGTIKMGGAEDFTNFVNAVIDEKSFDKLAGYIDQAKESPLVEVVAGGNYDKSKGYFIEPTVLVTEDPKYVTMCEELFGPVITIYVYKAANYEDAIYMVDHTSEYALTGAIFARDRQVIEHTTKKLRNSAGNFYINDKPTGAVVGQQPFGGARASGTNDKAGSMINLLRWVSPRTIKENFVPPTDYRYPFLQEE
jgi:1-pyrroline-5-carboxylate dehydrogenase